MFRVENIPLVPTMTLCINAVVKIEYKHPLNLDKFHLFVKLFLSCPKYLTTNQLTRYKIIMVLYFDLSATFYSLS